ncbi:hypothetical protein E4U43_007968 [Claviceps pusilla]|uniref:Uncharacterized protein n=1 Tax=Claviceps pusilla TaxID=123648 RepID=A0A9P7NCM7_9HYPO|nr:hypothetical protein E4U43_007968 [Claviceps pusilla]
MAQRPSRRSRYDDFDEYDAPSPHDPYYGSPPPQGRKSDRRSRRHSPDVAPQVDAYAPRHGHSRREPPESLPMSKQAGGGGRRARSPPPYYTSEPLPRDSRRDGQREEYRREPRRPHHHARDHSREYDDGGYQPMPKEKSRRSHRDDLDYRPRRNKAPSPVDYHRHHRPQDRDDAGYRPRKSRPFSPEPRPRARSYMSSPFGSEDEIPRRRARSHDRTKTRDVFSPRGRGRDHDMAPPSSKPSHARRQSVPAPPPASATKTAKKQQWWQNPYIQAGAYTALSAGAKAVMQSRNDPSPWLGAKGAKVATAALGAALMDGLGGKKQQRR